MAVGASDVTSQQEDTPTVAMYDRMDDRPNVLVGLRCVTRPIDVWHPLAKHKHVLALRKSPSGGVTRVATWERATWVNTCGHGGHSCGRNRSGYLRASVDG
jgi:hypothetical protein